MVKLHRDNVVVHTCILNTLYQRGLENANERERRSRGLFVAPQTWLTFLRS